MKIYRWLVLSWVYGLGAWAQVPAPQKPPEVLRVIEVKQADVSELAITINRALGSLAVLTADPGRRMLIVRGAPEAVDFVEMAVKRLDQPPVAQPRLNVELTVHLLSGSTQEGRGEAPPADLASTLKQLTALFPYKNYTVLESFVLRGRDGQMSETTGSLPNSASTYRFLCRPSVGSGPAPRSIRLDDLRLEVKWNIHSSNNVSPTTIFTGLDTREGQKVVVGKANLAETADALIVVVSPKVVE